MNDLDLMKEFRADAAPPDQATLGRARRAMFAEPAEKPAARRNRWLWRLAPFAAVTAAIAADAVVATTGDRPGPGIQPVPDTVAAPADAAQVFRLAAAGARAEPVLDVRSDQFVYVRSRYASAGLEKEGQGDPRYVPPVPKDRQIWLSVDGSKPGLLRDGGPGDGPIDAGDPGYPRDLPTDATAMRKWLYADAASYPKKPGGPSLDTRAFNKVGDTLRERYLPPDSRAALFEAAATIPGVKLDKGVVDLAGRRGVAVSRTEVFGRFELIFDAKSHRFLGERVVAGKSTPPYPRNAVVNWTAQLEIAIVDRAGQLR